LVIINAASALYVGGIADDFKEAAKIATESIDSGKTKEKLEDLIRATTECYLIAVRNAQKTGNLVNNDASPHHCDKCQKSDSEQKVNGIRHNAVSRSHGSHYRRKHDDEYHW
jgi:hypothetical protein